jgi:arginyl-tRNA synthetase
MKQRLHKLLKQTLSSLVDKGMLESVPEHIRIDHSKDKIQGDFATNIAMVLSKQAKCTPRVLAQQIKVDVGIGNSWQQAH